MTRNSTSQHIWRFSLAAALFAIASYGLGQDRRTVVEPKIPAVCITLHARLRLHGGKLRADDESKLDTARVQQALDGCTLFKAVELAGGTGSDAFLVGPIQIPAGITLLIDHGATLLASRDPRLYDVRAGSCGVVDDQPEGCRAVITVSHAPHAAIMGEGLIDGRGGEKLLNGSVTWWELAEKARGGGRQQVPRLIVVDGSDDFTLYRITLRNSPNFHVLYRNGRGLTVWDLKIDTPQHARNTDGVDPASAEDITITKSFIRTGDDNVAIKGSGNGVGYVSVIDDHFYYGHGMSIGSETFGGVHDVLVQELMLDGPDNGLRIKSNSSRGGVVERVTYRDVCIRAAKRPIVLDTHYESAEKQTGMNPIFRDIHFEDVRILGGGQISVVGTDSAHKLSVWMNGVTLDDPTKDALHAAYAEMHYGPGPVNFTLAGEEVMDSGDAGSGAGKSCDGRFVPFEALR
jgi:polygalacturonase